MGKGFCEVRKRKLILEDRKLEILSLRNRYFRISGTTEGYKLNFKSIIEFDIK